VSEGETSGSPLALPADMLIGHERASGEPPPWLGLLAATLLHLLVLVWLFITWSHPPTPRQEPEVIPVQVVFAAPPPPPPPPQPAQAQPPPPAPPAPLSYRESGPDQRTTAPPPAETLAPEAATPPPPAPERPKAEKTAPEPPPEKPDAPAEKSAAPESAKPKPPKDVAHLEPPKKEAETPRAQRLAPTHQLKVMPGERLETGDPFLNQLHDLIERHRVYPRVMGQFGLPVEGTAIYGMALDRSGRIIDLQLEHSSGAAGIDRAVADMIRNSAPFPPLPANYPTEIGITVTIRLFPPPS
jgi:periplasmic protein TonB